MRWNRRNEKRGRGAGSRYRVQAPREAASGVGGDWFRVNAVPCARRPVGTAATPVGRESRTRSRAVRSVGSGSGSAGRCSRSVGSGSRSAGTRNRSVISLSRPARTLNRTIPTGTRLAFHFCAPDERERAIGVARQSPIGNCKRGSTVIFGRERHLEQGRVRLCGMVRLSGY